MTYGVVYSAAARRALTDRLPEPVAWACHQFCKGDLADAPRRVGKELREPRSGQWSARRGEYRVIYVIDDDRQQVTVLTVDHRRDVYR